MGAALSIPASHRAAPKTLSAANDCYSEIMLGGLTTACLSRDGLARMMLQDCLMARDSAQSQNPAQPKLIFASNGHVIAMARDEAFRTLLAKADVIHADGQAMVFVSHLTRTPIPERSATTDFLHDASKVAARYGLRFFLLGATEEANAEAARRLAGAYPGLKIVGRRHRVFGILCRGVLHHSGHVSAGNPGRGNRSRAYQPASGLAWRGNGFDSGGLDILVDRIPLPPQNRGFCAVSAL